MIANRFLDMRRLSTQEKYVPLELTYMILLSFRSACFSREDSAVDLRWKKTDPCSSKGGVRDDRLCMQDDQDAAYCVSVLCLYLIRSNSQVSATNSAPN